ncbi:hypothetical protein AAFC00_002770 [Neodothiora populina]|uniref:JmjC domain-containing protein n=1 Tax=Neodothiora populina TaxID=2781224 RepID=A0ABR3P876_9PEZI
MSQPEGSDSSPQTLNTALLDLLSTYQDLNPNVADEIHEEPSPLEFMQYVARNRPLIIRGGAESFKAYRDWGAAYLTDVVGECDVNVSVTPFGNADSILTERDGSLSFVKPYEQTEKFRDLISYIQNQSMSHDDHGPVKYGQTQNDNLRNEYASLFTDVPEKGPPFARIALQRAPEAINFWLGNARSVTSLHRDNYENIYAQVRGRKHFVLLPPVASVAVNEQALPSRTYVLTEEAARLRDDTGLAEIKTGDLEARLDGEGEEGELVRWALWDPDVPGQSGTPYSEHVRPMKVTLNEGDLLYLPALWYHKVSQSCGQEGFCCAVNYWYDMDFSGSFWAVNAFVKDIAQLSQGQEQDREKAVLINPALR